MINRSSPFRDLAGAFVLAKLLAVIAGAIYSARGAPAGAPELLAHGMALLLFSSALRLRNFQVPAPWPPGLNSPLRPFAWWLLALPIGLLLRWGSEGLHLLATCAFDAGLAASEIQSLGSSAATLPTPIGWLGLSVGAVEEEFVYRVMLLGWLAVHLGWPAALVIIGIAFGLIHANSVALAGSIGLGLLYLLSRSLAVTATAHLAANLAHPLLVATGLRINVEQGLQFAAIFAVALFFVVATGAGWLWLATRRSRPMDGLAEEATAP